MQPLRLTWLVNYIEAFSAVRKKATAGSKGLFGCLIAIITVDNADIMEMGVKCLRNGLNHSTQSFQPFDLLWEAHSLVLSDGKYKNMLISSGFKPRLLKPKSYRQPASKTAKAHFYFCPLAY